MAHWVQHTVAEYRECKLNKLDVQGVRVHVSPKLLVRIKKKKKKGNTGSYYIIYEKSKTQVYYILLMDNPAAYLPTFQNSC